MHNFRTEIGGHNQISAVFAPEYGQFFNIQGYDRICQYYLQPRDYETVIKAELVKENFGSKVQSEDEL